MHYKKEACRNFQRGSCQYGERCKFLHVIQQQQKPNPFGFGVQNGLESKGTIDLGSKQKQFKPFENKWTRFSPIPSGGALSTRQSDNKPQSVNHKCTDPDSCKRQIVEDFEHERPLWKLTCYGHWTNAPCDIVGDVSYEELRAAAYDDAKNGLSLQAIVARERNLLNSKITEFEDLLRNPYAGPASSALAKQSPFPVASPNALTAQTSAPPTVASFSQLGPSLNLGPGIRPSAPSSNAFGQPNSFPNSSQTSGAFGANNFRYNSGSFGLPTQTFGSSFTSNIADFSNSGTINAQSNPFSTSVSTLKPSSSSYQSPILSNGPNSATNVVGHATTDAQLVSDMQRETVSGDMSIWLKEKWMPGEIPEEAPPDAIV